MSLVAELEAVKELLSDRKRWTKGEFARDKYSHPLDDAADERACRWCVLGACRRLRTSDEAEALIADVTRALGFCGGVPSLNDSGGFSKVHECLDLAIKKAKEQGS